MTDSVTGMAILAMTMTMMRMCELLGVMCRRRDFDDREILGSSSVSWRLCFVLVVICVSHATLAKIMSEKMR